MFSHQCAYQFVHIAFGNRVNFIEREVNAVIGDAALWVVVGADALTAIAEPIRLLRSLAMALFCASTCLDLILAASTAIACALLACWLRPS